LCIVFLISFCLSVCPHETSPFHWMDFEEFFRTCLLQDYMLLHIVCVVPDTYCLICFNVLWHDT
jgi:hypothetical protein